MGYFEARRARAKRNHESLYNLAKDVTAIEPEIEVYVNRNDKVHESMVFIHDETINRVGFTEVPFRWNGPTPKNGYLPNHAMPYVADDIINNMKEFKSGKQYKQYIDRESFLKWTSYLVPINN